MDYMVHEDDDYTYESDEEWQWVGNDHQHIKGVAENDEDEEDKEVEEYKDVEDFEQDEEIGVIDFSGVGNGFARIEEFAFALREHYEDCESCSGAVQDSITHWRFYGGESIDRTKSREGDDGAGDATGAEETSADKVRIWPTAPALDGLL